MCPSDIYELPVAPMPVFGPPSEVFTSDDAFPCSITLRDALGEEAIRIQVQRDEEEWRDYEEGDLIVGKSVKCRLAVGGETRKVRIEVFHT